MGTKPPSKSMFAEPDTAVEPGLDSHAWESWNIPAWESENQT